MEVVFERQTSLLESKAKKPNYWTRSLGTDPYTQIGTDPNANGDRPAQVETDLCRWVVSEGGWSRG